MVVRLSSEQTKRAHQLSLAMTRLTTAIRLARSDGTSSPQAIKQLLDEYCRIEAELRALLPRAVRPLPHAEASPVDGRPGGR